MVLVQGGIQYNYVLGAWVSIGTLTLWEGGVSQACVYVQALWYISAQTVVPIFVC